jgi:branched-chain amino acid transport system permease protein
MAARLGHPPTLIALAATIALPWVASTYILHLAIMAGIFSILSLSVNLLSGYTGQFSIGHAGFWAIGAYTSALLTTNLHYSFWIGLPAAGFVAMIFGLIIGIPAIRVSGVYLAVVTIAFGLIVQTLLFNLEGLTGGAHGIYAIPRPSLGRWQFHSREEFYWLVLAVLLLLVAVAVRLMNSYVGRAFIAIREDELAAQAIGIHTTYYRVVAFLMSAFFAGLAGSLYAHYLRYINPEAFGIIISINILMMVIVGGLGSIPGSILGAIVVYLLPEFLRFLGHAYYMVFGALVIAMLVFLPNGLIDVLDRLYSLTHRRLSGTRSHAAGRRL